MIQRKTRLIVADNSGAQEMSVIHIYGSSKRAFAGLGDIVQCVVRKADPTGTVKDDELVKVVIIRTRKEHGRSDGSYIRFDDNAGVVIDNADDKNPRGTRVFGPVARELKEKGFDKIASMATELY
ncbi:50S ribosomal protein L14 [Candidatus Gottesmanbacteria bacterium RIFCSPHIGHO2_01_FULL_46_14]|uniref:Large ribosomal subunit protein uL14 n=3 Tax=Candidatus Gottesmaniibacteriota TaxID=1752720 RepID=A0A1F5ZSD3_9BACT|nr:MAG: 50S ribosomal protein L14 [Candidatus Gottesmanbacteria bacterium GW2011_GWA1_47_8]OGG15245.1 MAG: 50S ribosomal protein L14 [Candidatus Gottesmanbacteria bacterium RIFCSPHIGHO2_01_FULL_46_14]OGG28658.1 MAG: 50S ribosomal protein L14 [Candidatus Gottesmanbacteria bacterium RIFCSPLOWO2_01_FULL_46_21]